MSALVVWSVQAQEADTPLKDRVVLRRPVAMVLADDWLWVASRQTGTVSLIDVETGLVWTEVAVSTRLDDLISLPERQVLVAVDSESHRLITLQIAFNDDRPTDLEVLSVQSVAKYPVSLAASPNDKLVSCASKWSRRLTVLRTDDLVAGHGHARVIDLPFPPLKQCFLSDRFVLVADAHGGELAIVDVEVGRIRSRQQLLGHNIRGLCLTARRNGAKRDDGDVKVVLSHQLLNVASSTTRSTISWGGVISNTLHTIPVERLLASTSVETVEPVHGSLFPLGQEGQGAGDPGDVVCGRDGQVWVAVHGAGQVLMRPSSERQLVRGRSGRGPRKILADERRRQILVLNQFDDSISVLDADSLTPLRTITLGNRRASRSAAEAGEELFHDARLSLDDWYSCHSCHSDGHTTGLLSDNSSDGSFGTPKRILTLLGTGNSGPWAWNGGFDHLEDQIRNSIEQTMAGPGKRSPAIGNKEIESLRAYLSTLRPAPGISVARAEVDLPSVNRGAHLFTAYGCNKCHQPPFYTSRFSFDAGLEDEAGQKLFNPPSLLGVSQRGPYFHDSRASNLVDVLTDYNHGQAAALSSSEVADLVDFLKSL